MSITPAQLRVLSKASANGFVMAAGGFSPDGAADPIDNPHFDRQRHIDNLINAKLLTWGGGANQYVLTDAGRAHVDRPRRTRKAAEQ